MFSRRLISLEHWTLHHTASLLRLCWQITGSAVSRDSRRTCRSSIKPHDCSLIASAGRRRVCSVTYDLLPPPSLFSARIKLLYEAHYYRTKLLKQVQPVWAPRISADRIKTKWLSHRNRNTFLISVSESFGSQTSCGFVGQHQLHFTGHEGVCYLRLTEQHVT